MKPSSWGLNESLFCKAEVAKSGDGSGWSTGAEVTDEQGE